MKKIILLFCISFAYLGADFDIQGAASSEESNDNMRLVNKVLDRIKERYNGFNVNVYAENGEVTLRGTVKSNDDKNAIENEVKNIGGVKKVRNVLEVRK
jgi:osmotically-inducible protein OsmY